MTVVPLPHRSARSVSRTQPLRATQIRLSFEVVLGGATRYTDALDVIDSVRRLTERVGASGLTVGSGAGHSPPTLAKAEPPVDASAVRIFSEMRRVQVGPEDVELTKLEYDLMLFLAEHPRTVFTRRQLLQGVWGHLHAGERTIDVHIRRLRAKVREDLVVTVRGVGYRLADDTRVRIVRAISEGNPS